MIAGCVSTGVVILAIQVFVAVLLYVFLKRTGRKRKGESVSWDAVDDEHDEEPISVKYNYM